MNPFDPAGFTLLIALIGLVILGAGLASGAFERSMLGVSASLELVPILDQLFPQIALALAAPRASALVEQIRRELH